MIIPLAPQIYYLNFISEHSNPCWQTVAICHSRSGPSGRNDGLFFSG
jgi:hypothetical protein